MSSIPTYEYYKEHVLIIILYIVRFSMAILYKNKFLNSQSQSLWTILKSDNWVKVAISCFVYQKALIRKT